MNEARWHAAATILSAVVHAALEEPTKPEEFL